jgi:hypothetical protein
VGPSQHDRLTQRVWIIRGACRLQEHLPMLGEEAVPVHCCISHTVEKVEHTTARNYEGSVGARSAHLLVLKLLKEERSLKIRRMW